MCVGDKNWKNARKYFLKNDERCRVWDSKNIKWVMHHINPEWQHNDPERYNQWNIEDLLPMTASAHTVIHNLGKKHSEDRVRKNSEGHKGIHPTEETIKKMIESHTGTNNPWYGCHHTEEARKKMRENHADVNEEKNPFYNKHHTEATKRKLSEYHTGLKPSEETRKKISDANKGRHWYNNGIISVMEFECPEGFVLGRLRKDTN